MSEKSHPRMMCLFLTVIVLLACGLFPTLETSSTPIPLTTSPDISPTPESTPTLGLPTDTPTSPPPTITPEPAVVINLGPGRFGKPLWLEVVKGDYQLTSGATLMAGSAIDAYEDWLTFPRGLVINVKDGEITLKGKIYPAGTTLFVDSQGNLTER
jgi:hypothetical protein